MDQISPPMRIALAVAVAFALVWFVALRPKGDGDAAAEAPLPTPANANVTATATPAGLANNPNGPTAKTGLGRAVQGANRAKQTQEASDARSGAAAAAPSTAASGAATAAPTTAASGAATAAPTTSAAAGTPAATAAPATASGGASAPAKAASPAQVVAKTTGLPTDISGALAKKEIVVLLFWDKAGSDDRAVRRAVRGLGQRGKVLVHVAPVTKVARYAAITQGVDVARSPSVVVVDRRLKAQLLAGYVSRDTVRQAIADAKAVKA